jgi:lipid-A-disaccharide synthase
LIDALKEKTGGNVRFCGVGGPAMADCGFVSNFAMEELSLMGVVEILPHLPRLLRRIKETARDVESLKPHVVITIDSPGFNHRVADRIKGIDIPVVHYVAPSVWAWKPWRARKIAKHFDHLLALLPFEPPYFETEGLPTTFVGHSVIESGADQGDGKSFRQSREIVGDTKILCVLPGSRSGEVSRLLPVIGRTLDLLNEKDLIIIVPVVDAVQVPVEAATKTWPYKVHLVAGE